MMPDRSPKPGWKYLSAKPAFWRYFFLITFAAAWFASTPAMADQHPMPVFVSILPQQYFVDKIGGDLVSIEVLVAPGASPHTYEPKPRQMAAIAGARLYFAIGVPFENVWLPKIAATNARLTIVHTEAGIARLPMANGHESGDPQVTDDPGHGTDPHIWLSPALVQIQAEHIRNALQQTDPLHKTVYEHNYQSFIAEIETLDNDLRARLAPVKGAWLMVFHPSWGYFAREYGLIQVPIEVMGKEPKPAQLQQLILEARAHHIRALLVQPQFSTRSAQVVAEAIGAQIVSADPMAAAWAANLEQLALRLQTVLN